MADSLDGVPSSFKETQIGLIPTDWDAAAIEETINETIGGDWGKDDNDARPDWVRCQVIRGTDFPSVASGRLDNVPARYIRPSSVEKRQLAPDDLLVEISGGSKYQPTGRILRMSPDGLANAHLPLLFTNFVKRYRVDQSRVVPSFFHLFWQYLYSMGRTRVYEKRTTGIRNFKYKEFLANELIALPPLAEQRRIAHVLSTIQRAIEAQDKVIAAAKELKRSLMERLFTYGPYAEAAPTKETEIAEIPKHWNVVRLGDMADKPQYGYTQSANEKPVGPKFLRITDITQRGVDWTAVPYCRCDSDTLEKHRLKRDDILFARTGATTGKSYIIRDCPEAVFASYLIRVTVKDDMVPSYVYNYFNSTLYWGQITRSKAGSAQAGVNATRLSNLLIPVAPVDEQQQIADILSTVDHKIEAEESREAALQELFKSMLHQLMTGQLRAKDIEV